MRDSCEVQSALRLYAALTTNNYVRFFKLVRGAGYLASCLLQRYFNQVRTRALDVITRAFCPSKVVVEVSGLRGAGWGGRFCAAGW